MSAKRPQTLHGKALAALIKGQITREEYRLCCQCKAWINGAYIFLPSEFRWDGRRLEPLYSRSV